jgi:hypothetical protein
VRTWFSPFPSDLNVGYSHCILTGNGSTNDMITFSTTWQITHVMFLPLFSEVHSGFLMCWGPFFITDATSCPWMSYSLIWTGPYTIWGAAANAYPAEPVYNSIYDFIQQWEDSWP